MYLILALLSTKKQQLVYSPFMNHGRYPAVRRNVNFSHPGRVCSAGVQVVHLGNFVFGRRGAEGDCVCLASAVYEDLQSPMLVRNQRLTDVPPCAALPTPTEPNLENEGTSREKGRLKETGNGERTGKDCPRGFPLQPWCSPESLSPSSLPTDVLFNPL